MGSTFDSGTNSVMSTVWVEVSSSAFNSSLVKVTYSPFWNSYPLTISSRGTTTSSLIQIYCCRNRDPHGGLCKKLNEIDVADSVAEYRRTGILTRPNEIVADAIERIAMRQ